MGELADDARFLNKALACFAGGQFLWKSLMRRGGHHRSWARATRPWAPVPMISRIS